MRHPIKLLIQKKHEFSDTFNRYYTVDRIIIDGNFPIDTEAKLCWYVYRKFGEGRYMMLAFQKGISGFWNFWIGYLMPNGFIRDTRKSKEMERLKQQLKNAQSYEEREEIEKEMTLEKDITDTEKKLGRFGVYGIKKSRAGVFNAYEKW